MRPQRSRTSLPLWAQREIKDLEWERDEALGQIKVLSQANAVVEGMDWYTVRGEVPLGADGELVNLFVLTNNHARAVCSLRQGDVLLVGRRKREQGQ